MKLAPKNRPDSFWSLLFVCFWIWFQLDLQFYFAYMSITESNFVVNSSPQSFLIVQFAYYLELYIYNLKSSIRIFLSQIWHHISVMTLIRPKRLNRTLILMFSKTLFHLKILHRTIGCNRRQSCNYWLVCKTVCVDK